MKHFATPAFWECYERLPDAIQRLADKNYALLKENPQHPSLHFKKVGRLCSIRVGIRYRALGAEVPGGVVWFWIGTHANYDKLLS